MSRSAANSSSLAGAAGSLSPENLPDAPHLDAELAATLGQRAWIIAGAAGVMLLAGWIMDARQFYYSYLWGYVWALSIALGALFWNLVLHVTAADWAVGIRRTFENLHSVLPLLAILFVPIAVGIDTIFKWSTALDLHGGKRIWLSTLFFVIRFAFYFAIWIVYSSIMRKWSRRCDTSENPDERIRLQHKLRRYAPSGILLLALTSTFAIFDLVMSLNYHWFSTIFGVIFWADCIRASLASCALIVIVIRSAGYLRRTITREHFHDIGKLMFAFAVFWAYVGFAQYFLYWYGNIPEETSWYWDRREGTWYLMSILLPIGYFGVPFLVLLPRGSKRSPRIVGLVAAWVLLWQMTHLYWEIMPEGLKTSVKSRPQTGVAFNWMDLVSIVMFGGVLIGCVVRRFRDSAMIPIRDAHIAESIRHEVDEFGDAQE